MSEETALVKHESSLMLTPVMNVALAKSRLAEFQEFVGEYLTESKDGGIDGGDFGIIPGTKKKTLLKSGAEKLMEIYGLYADYAIESKIENFETGLFYYQIKCVLRSKRDDSIVGTGPGSCNTYESRYRWRESKKKCPSCGAEAIIKGKQEYIKKDGSGFWLCYKKNGGCGEGFKEGDQSIESQATGRVENPDIIDAANTVLKVAKKRAQIDAVISVTRSSGIFTQDLDDLPAPVKNITPEPSQNTQPSRQGATESYPFGPGVSEVVEKGKGQFLNAWTHEINKLKEELNTWMALPCFTLDDRTVMKDLADKVQTLESMKKLVERAKAHAEKNAKAQQKADKEAELKAQLEISQAEGL